MNYLTCLATLEKLPKTQEHQIFTYNIEGNLGLTLLRAGNQAGLEKVETSLAQLKHIKGEKSFDYASLYNNYLALKQSWSSHLFITIPPVIHNIYYQSMPVLLLNNIYAWLRKIGVFKAEPIKTKNESVCEVPYDE